MKEYDDLLEELKLDEHDIAILMGYSSATAMRTSRQFRLQRIQNRFVEQYRFWKSVFGETHRVNLGDQVFDATKSFTPAPVTVTKQTVIRGSKNLKK